ncbi:MAG TPA: hypothetical protein VFG47_13855, partial [Geminicoccaceae bacterium]|nr:hypothetical protein [Geminicoccaceae bacterium]
MEVKGRTVLVCDCEGTMALDGGALAKACGAAGGTADVNHQLCRAQLGNLEIAARGGRPLVVACTQEAPLFGEALAEAAPDLPVAYVNVRERAGWSEEGARATPKIAALLAEAALAIPPTPGITMRSEGACLVYGRDEAAIEAAKQLAARLDVTVLLSKPGGDVMPPRVRDVPVFRGTIARATGHLGAFELTVDDYAPPR